jgi:putative hemolysin
MSSEELISKEAVSKGLKLQKLKLASLAPLIIKALKLEKVNQLYANHADTKGMEFADEILNELQVAYEFNTDELKNIPQHEPFIVVANHPYGGIDGLMLLRILTQSRPDFKIMANLILQLIPALKDNFVPVNPFETSSKTGINISGIKKCLQALKEGHPIGIFPAGEVSSLKLNTLKISDKLWNPVVGKMILKAQVKVVPVYFSGHNSIAFNLLGLVHPALRTAKLPSELFNKTKEKIQIRVGKPINIKTINEFNDPNELLRFLRAKTYALESSLEIEPQSFISRLKFKKPDEPHPIINETSTQLIEQDLAQLPENSLLITHDHYKVYIAGARNIPSVLREISRLREITFREVGEGTNQSCDTDEYDLNYKHLFIWDESHKKIVGAYRIGLGDVLHRRYKKKGFYLNELFKIDKDFNPVLKNSLELGRSFITMEYQRKPYSLMLLWKGVLAFLKLHPNRYQYLIGPVSISNSFTSLSKDLLVDFIKKNHFDETLAEHVKPRKKYKYQHKGEGAALKDMSKNDIKALDNMIADIELAHTKIPVLIKKYLKQNAKIIAFNIDPKFNNSLDGFLVMEVGDIPEDTFEMVMR